MKGFIFYPRTSLEHSKLNLTLLIQFTFICLALFTIQSSFAENESFYIIFRTSLPDDVNVMSLWQKCTVNCNVRMLLPDT